MKQERKKQEYELGFELGVSACKRRVGRIPFSDEHCNNAINEKTAQNPKWSPVSLLRGWHNGYQFEIEQQRKQQSKKEK